MYQKKKIETICFIVISFVITIGISTKAYINKEKAEVKEVSSEASCQKIVVLDAGHGGEDGGAVSKNGVKESDINLKITLKVKKLLEENEISVVLTRSDQNAIYDVDAKTLKEKKVSDIKNRVKIGNNSSADIFVSIHLNKISQSKYFGWQCFFRSKDEQSQKLAETLQNSLNETMQRENKRVAMKINNIYIIDNVKIPISIVECGFLSNPEEEQLLQQEEYQDKLANGIYLGINKYFERNDEII